jgi:hypothetical protein
MISIAKGGSFTHPMLPFSLGSLRTVRVPGHDDHGFRRNVINQSSAS